MLTCATTGVICVTIELTGDRTGATFVGIDGMSAATVANCETTYEMGTIGLLATSGATSAKTSEICGPTAATFDMTAETSGTIDETFVTTVGANSAFGRCG